MNNIAIAYFEEIDICACYVYNELESIKENRDKVIEKALSLC